MTVLSTFCSHDVVEVDVDNSGSDLRSGSCELFFRSRTVCQGAHSAVCMYAQVAICRHIPIAL